MRFFAAHDPGNLRFLTALRMSATFPFVTPNVELPSTPVMKTMDTGLSDNFGIQDALRFLYVFQEWIGANTSGVVLVTIRDSEKSPEISSSASTKILKKSVPHSKVSMAIGIRCKLSTMKCYSITWQHPCLLG